MTNPFTHAFLVLLRVEERHWIVPAVSVDDEPLLFPTRAQAFACMREIADLQPDAELFLAVCLLAENNQFLDTAHAREVWRQLPSPVQEQYCREGAFLSQFAPSGFLRFTRHGSLWAAFHSELQHGPELFPSRLEAAALDLGPLALTPTILHAVLLHPVAVWGGCPPGEILH